MALSRTSGLICASVGEGAATTRARVSAMSPRVQMERFRRLLVEMMRSTTARDRPGTIMEPPQFVAHEAQFSDHVKRAMSHELGTKGSGSVWADDLRER